MDILIKAKGIVSATKYKNGKACLWVEGFEDIFEDIVELPPHGKLCEKEAVWDMLHGICVKCNENKDNEKHISCIWCKIKDAMDSVYGSSIPTVLEASK